MSADSRLRGKASGCREARAGNTGLAKWQGKEGLACRTTLTVHDGAARPRPGAEAVRLTETVDLAAVLALGRVLEQVLGPGGRA
jgi:hypothetical protein